MINFDPLNLIPPGHPLLSPDAISLPTLLDVDNRRKLLCQYIWGTDGLPTGITLDPTKTQLAFPTAEYQFGAVSNLSSMDTYWCEMPYGMQSGMYLYHPIESNGCLMVYHSGHDAGWVAEDALTNNTDPTQPGQQYGLVIPTLLKCGFTVLALSMPIYSAFRNPTLIVDGVPIQFTDHAQIFQHLEHPFSFFLQPVHQFLNMLGGGFQRISMMGLSGGGWTTTLCAAIDPRIQCSYPVASSYPIWLRPGNEGIGDAEQVWPEFYTIANYTELYVMGSAGAGRKQLQCLNEHDDCCFYGTRYLQYAAQVQAAVKALGQGQYDVVLDQTNMHHRVSRTVLSRILMDHEDVIDPKRLMKIVAGV